MSVLVNYFVNYACLIKLLDEVAGANCKAGSAIVALGIVNRRQIVINVDCTVGTLLFTKLAAHATGLTEFTGYSALFYVVAGNCEVSRMRHHYDHILGTGKLTCLAALAGFSVNDGNAIDYMNSIELTGLDAVAVTKAAISAVVHTVTEGGVVRCTVINAVVMILGCGAITACTAYESDHTLGMLSLYAHDLGDFLSSISTTGSAFIAGSFALYDRFGIVGTASESAATAVSAGQYFNNGFLTGVAFNGEGLGGESKNKSEECAEYGKNRNGIYNSHHIL